MGVRVSLYISRLSLRALQLTTKLLYKYLLLRLITTETTQINITSIMTVT